MTPLQPTKTLERRCRYQRCLFTPVGALIASRNVHEQEEPDAGHRRVSWRIPLCALHRASVTTEAITSDRIDAVEWEHRTDWSNDGGEPA